MLRHYTHVDNWYEWLTTSADELAQELRSPSTPRVLAHTRRGL